MVKTQKDEREDSEGIYVKMDKRWTGGASDLGGLRF